MVKCLNNDDKMRPAKKMDEMCENTHGQSTNNAPWSTNPFSFDFFLPQALKDHWTFYSIEGTSLSQKCFFTMVMDSSPTLRTPR